jgi:TRAP-type uncharacterized transport system fused permease subunit
MLAAPADFMKLSTYLMIGLGLLGCYSISAGIEGFLKHKLNPIFRGILLLAGFAMVYPETMSSIIGLSAFAVIYVLQAAQSKKAKLNSVI